MPSTEKSGPFYLQLTVNHLTNIFFLIQVLHMLTKNIQSPDTISFGVPGTNQQESAQKPIRYRNVKLEYYSNYCKT